MMAASDAINPAVPTVLDIVEAPDPTSEHADTAGLSAVVTSQDVKSHPRKAAPVTHRPLGGNKRHHLDGGPRCPPPPKPRPTAPRQPQSPQRHRT